MLLYLSFKFSPNQNNSYGPLLYMTERYNSTNHYSVMVTLKTLGLPIILSEEIVLTKRKMLQIHMLTFSFESSRKDRL